MIEIFKIIITAVLTATLTYWVNFKKEFNKKKYEINRELLHTVYDPIIKIINQSIFPGDGYEGLGLSEINEIIDIIDNNASIVDPKLDLFSWGFKEEIRCNSYNEMCDIYDEDRKFLEYISYRYNYIKKILYLPYDRSYFIIPRLYRRFKSLKYNLIKKISIRSLKTRIR